MTRRLRTAGTAFGALLIPACAGMPFDSTTLRPVSAIPPEPTPVAYRPLPTTPTTQAAKPRVVEKFAEGRPDAAPAVAEVPPPVPTAAAAPAPAPDKVASSVLVPAEHTAPAPVPAAVDPPRLILPAIGGIPAPEPKPDAEGVIRPHWPVIKGVGPLAEPPVAAAPDPDLVLPPPSELMKAAAEPAPAVAPPVIPPAKPDEGPAVAADVPPVTPVVTPPAPAAAPTTPPPPVLPPGVIGSSVHQSNASPMTATPAEQALSGDPVAPAAAIAAERLAGFDSPLVRAVLAFQQNRPDEAVEHLRGYDPATQQVLLTLLPAMARLGQGTLHAMQPAEMDVLLDQLTRVPNLLRPRASLRADNVCLCREVHNFAHVQPFPDRHEFRPGDIVYLYMELANFSCAPDPKGGFLVTLASSLELKDATGKLVWRADPKEAADHVSTPPQDYYRNFRVCVPSVPPGSYMLSVKTTDRPTGREVCKAVEMRVGAR